MGNCLSPGCCAGATVPCQWCNGGVIAANMAVDVAALANASPAVCTVCPSLNKRYIVPMNTGTAIPGVCRGVLALSENCFLSQIDIQISRQTFPVLGFNVFVSLGFSDQVPLTEIRFLLFIPSTLTTFDCNFNNTNIPFQQTINFTQCDASAVTCALTGL